MRHFRGFAGAGVVAVVFASACGGGDEAPANPGGLSGSSSGREGTGGTAAGASGRAGSSGGGSGTGGAAGAGAGGTSGGAGTSGASGADGGGTVGIGGTAGTVGTGGTAGTAGTTGTGGTAGTAGTGGAAPCRLAARWTVVDDYVRSAGEPSNIASITADSNGNVYAVGLARQGTFAGIVRKSTNGGRTWAPANWGSGLPNDAAADDAGNVYVTAGDNGVVLRKSADGGATWMDIDRIPLNSGSPSDPCNTGFVATGVRDIIVFGSSCDSAGWTVRRSADAGRTFQPAFTFRLAAGKPARLHDVGVADGDAYAIGTAVNASDASLWVAVRGAGMISDQFALAQGQLANGWGFGGEAPLLAAGFATEGSTTFGVVRRRGATGTWTTIDRFATRAIDVERVGDQIIVAGTVDQAGIERVLTRRSDDGGATFTPLDDYAYAAGRASSSSALTADPRGNVYAAVGGRDSSGVNHWVVRKLACE